MGIREMVLLFLLVWTGWSWCLKTTVNLTVQATKVDYSPDGTLLAVTSVASNRVYLYETINFFKVFTYAPTGGDNVRTARFTRDGTYLGIGFDNGNVMLLSGTAPFSSTPIRTISSQNKNIADIDFNYGYDKLLVCYVNDDNIFVIKNYASASPTSNSRDTTRVQWGCKWSKNDYACEIDDDRYVKCYDVDSSGVIATTYRTRSRSGDNDFRDLAVRPTTVTPIKVVLAGGHNNDLAGSYFLNSGGSSTSASSVSSTISTFKNTPIDTVKAACYAPDASIYSFAGYDYRVWIFNEASNSQVFMSEDSKNRFLSCMFSPDSQYLAVSSDLTGGVAYVYIYHRTCFFCPPGYYQNTVYGCAPCNNAITACSLCYNSTYCTSCFQGYYYNVTDYLCRPCTNTLAACSTCSSSSACLECDNGYYLKSDNTCVSCLALYPGCLACNGTKCYLCDLDYFLNSGNCSTCSVPSCLRCFNSTVCLHCTEGYYLAAGGLSCPACNYSCLVCGDSAANCSACTRGYYLSSNACLACASNCLQCTNGTTCLDCRLGYYSNSGTCELCLTPCATCGTTNATCLSCTLGYYLSGSNCSPCTNNCSLCSNSTACSACQLGHYLTAAESCLSCNSQYPGCQTCVLGTCYTCFETRYLSSSTACSVCSASMPGCQLCANGTECLFCAVGYYYTTNSGSTACARCPGQCLSCTSNTSCISCAVGYWLNSTTCQRCSYPCESCSTGGCLSCVEGYYINGSTCSNCTNIDHCLTCLSETWCTSCLQGYFADNGTCWGCASPCLQCNSTQCALCNLGYYLSAGSCLPCGDNCSLCTSPNDCQSCDVGYFFNSTSGSDQCQQCGTLSNGCLTCNSTVCFHCQQGYYLGTGACHFCFSSVDNCALCSSGTDCTTCMQGYYLASAINCSPCGMLTGCLDCEGGSNCTLCASGYYLEANWTCSPCPASCTVCASTSSCSVCPKGYFLDGTSCFACEDSLIGCSACSSNSSCLSCSGGYLLGGSSLCEPCSSIIPACSLCSNSTACQSCQQGYFLNGSSLCQLCSSSSSLDGCLLCNSSSHCQYCQGGYYLSSGSCLLCSSSIYGCSQCTDGLTCLDCTSGYFLNGTTSACELCSANLTGCIFCQSNETCLQCQGGYYLLAGACLACAQPGCEICNATDPYSCLTCNTGYFLSGFNCSTCPQAGCLNCNASQCLDCQTGYYLSGGSCLLCSGAKTGCSKCSSVSTCTECGGLFYLSGGNCLTCHSSMAGCSFCKNSSECLSCDGGYYLNGNTCSPCSDLPGCLICNGSSSCISCASGYLLANSSCVPCGTLMPNCYQCYNTSLCAVCASGYQVSLTAAGCEVMKFTSGTMQPPATPAELSFKSFYVNSSSLKHIFSVADSSSKFQNVDRHNWTDVAKIYLENTAGATLLNILAYELSVDELSLVFYTDNPMTIGNQQMPVTNPGRILTGESMSGVNVLSSFSLPQSVIADVLPSVLMATDLVMSFDLSQSQFYVSYVQASYSLSFYLFGLVVTILLFLYGFCRATCLTLYGRNAEIAGHIFAMKTLSAVVYPTYAQYVNFCLGFMTVDLPWLNSRLPSSFFSSNDQMPTGYHFYFQNMNLASMHLVTCLFFLMLLCLAYCLMAETRAETITIKEKENSSKNYKFKAFREFLMNYFGFGFVFAGFSAIVGTFLNQSSILTLNGIFYILGVILYGVVLSEAFAFLVINKRIGRLRVALKGTFLAAAGLNPLYLSAVAVIVDAILIVVEYNQRKKVLVCPKTWLAQHFLILGSLLCFFFVPDSFLTIGIVIALISAALLLQVYQYCQERDQSSKQMQFFQIQQTTISDGHFWVLEDKQRKGSNSSDVDIDQKINQKESPKKESNFIFDLQGENNKEGMTTGYSNHAFEPKRRTRKFKLDHTQKTAWNKAGQTIPQIFLDEA